MTFLASSATIALLDFEKFFENVIFAGEVFSQMSLVGTLIRKMTAVSQPRKFKWIPVTCHW